MGILYNTVPHFETNPPFASNPQEFSAHRNDVQHRFAELAETLRRKQVPRQGWVSGPTKEDWPRVSRMRCVVGDHGKRRPTQISGVGMSCPHIPNYESNQLGH